MDEAAAEGECDSGCSAQSGERADVLCGPSRPKTAKQSPLTSPLAILHGGLRVRGAAARPASAQHARAPVPGPPQPPRGLQQACASSLALPAARPSGSDRASLNTRPACPPPHSRPGAPAEPRAAAGAIQQGRAAGGCSGRRAAPEPPRPPGRVPRLRDSVLPLGTPNKGRGSARGPALQTHLLTARHPRSYNRGQQGKHRRSGASAPAQATASSLHSGKNVPRPVPSVLSLSGTGTTHKRRVSPALVASTASRHPFLPPG